MDATTDEDPRLKEIVARLRPHRPEALPGEWLKLVVHGLLMDTWCFTARQDKARPGYCEYSDQRPIPPEVVAEQVGVLHSFFEQCMTAAADAGHILKGEWSEQRLIVFPAMVKRADTYTKRRMESDAKASKRKVKQTRSKHIGTKFEHSSISSSESTTPVHVPVSVPVHSEKEPESAGDLFTDDQEPTSVDALVQVWNDERQPGPKVQARNMPDARRKAAQRALREIPNLADWRTVIRFLNSQPFANAPGTGEHGTWRASFDWLIKPGKCAEYLERQRLDGTMATERNGDVVGRDASKGRTGWERGKYTGLGRTATGA